MTIQDWFPAATTTFLFGLALWLSRNLITTRLAKTVQHEFDSKLETIRAEFRRSEESFKADLRSKENQIEALRGGALSALASRQVALAKRRLEAVDQLWSEVTTSLAKLKYASMVMVTIDFDKASEMVAKSPQAQEIFKVIAGPIEPLKLANDAAKARPFVTQIAWALFSAYQSIILLSVTQLQVLKLGVDGAKYFKKDAVQNLIKVALPHQADYVAQYGSAGYPLLLDELESRLLEELKKMLEGGESDKATVEQAAAILKESDRVMESARAANTETKV
jgi:hypothetical protein